jgi:hypothetical protein
MFRRHASLLVWIAYFVVPTDAAGLVRGIPLGPLETVALLTLAWLAVRGEAPRRAWIVALVLAVTAISGTAVPGTGGFRARYFSNAAGTGAPELSTEYGDASFTRIDRRLDFALGETELPLAFFNDIARFNFHDPAGPRRRYLEFAAAWTGQWWVEAGDHTLYLEATDATAELFVDGARVATVTPDTDAAERTVPLTMGWHRLDVTLSSPYGGPRRLAAGEVRNGRRQPFDATTVATQRVRPWQVTAGWALRLVKTGCDVAALAWLAWLFAVSVRRRLAPLTRHAAAWRQRAHVAPLFALVATTEALAYAWPWARQLMIMPGGDDPMTYEWYSRDILLNGILMNGGAPAGQGEPFYYQALYPYFLAAVHFVFGEGMFGVMLWHHLLVAAAVWVMVKMAVAIAGEDAWPATLACGVVFAIGKHWAISSDLRNESLYVPLLVMWTAAMMRVCLAPSRGRAAGAGVLGAVTAMTRSTALGAWPLLFAACWWIWRPLANRRALMGVLVLSSISVFSLIAVRNWIVAHEVSFTSSELGITLLGGNEPPPGLVIDPARAALYERAGIGPLTAQVVEYAVVAPQAFALHQGRKALFALGYYEPYAPGRGVSPIYLAGWMLALVGFVIAMGSPRVPRAVIAIPALVSASQFVSVVLVYPKDERLILPIYAVLVPYAGIAVTKAMAYLARR